ncbi:PilN domain-containing protein [Paludibaculum fermentans]|uniref:PilN domain-containing protein n=1 Tax=Paludibaculum fermentans TaxID=1473598 RepID=UPI003EC03B36
MSGVKIPINLSQEPFRKDRPILVASAITGFLLLGVLLMLVSIIGREREAARESRELMARIDQQLSIVNQQYSKIEAQLRQPVNSAVLDRSLLLNALLIRKGISWTRLFEDLEKVFPGNVRLVAVRPYVTGDNLVQLDMVVGAQSPEPVIQLLRRLEGSNLFGATALLSSQPPSQNEPLYRYRVSVNYAQKL